jgi:hypothetical protein
MRAIVLYPMNALVNDQLSRLRRILSRGTSPDWQRRNLDGNVLHFGMYTGSLNQRGVGQIGGAEISTPPIWPRSGGLAEAQGRFARYGRMAASG